MTTQKKISPKDLKKQYETIVVGSGLSGLLVSHRLSQFQDVLLIESKEDLGGATRKVLTNDKTLPSGLAYVPDSEASPTLLSWLERETGIPIEREKRHLPPLTFEGGQLIPFVGFGERKSSSIPQLSYYNRAEQWYFTSPPEQWTHQLSHLFQGEALVNSQVTGVEVHEGKATHVIVNGAKKVGFNHLVLALSPFDGVVLFEDQWIAPRFRQKIAKSQEWTSVSLHFCHSQGFEISERAQQGAIHFLMGSKSDFEPCVGRFFPNENEQDPTIQSLWLSLIPSDLTEDMEQIGAQIRYMKKQIKRAYASALEDVDDEKIIVQPYGGGTLDLPFKSPGQIPPFNNIYLASSLVGPSGGLLGAIEAAQTVLENFKGEETEVSKLQILDSPMVPPEI